MIFLSEEWKKNIFWGAPSSPSNVNGFIFFGNPKSGQVTYRTSIFRLILSRYFSLFFAIVQKKTAKPSNPDWTKIHPRHADKNCINLIWL